MTRFEPSHRLSHVPPTPVEKLDAVRELGRRAGLEFVYVGNVPGHPAESTYCPQCGRLVVGREGITVTKVDLDGGRCPGCGREINIVGLPEAGG